MYIRFHGTVISLSNVIVRVKSIFKVYEVLQDRIRRKFYEVILILVHRKAKIFFSVLSICRKNEVLRNFYISSVLSLILLLKKIVQSTGLVLNLLFFIYFVHVLHASDACGIVLCFFLWYFSIFHILSAPKKISVNPWFRITLKSIQKSLYINSVSNFSFQAYILTFSCTVGSSF